MDPSDETTGVTDAGMDDLLLLGGLERKELVSSFKLVPRNLDAEETKRLSSEAKAQR